MILHINVDHLVARWLASNRVAHTDSGVTAVSFLL